MSSLTKASETEQRSAPDLVAVGPQRTASSWLDRALREHPLLRLPTHVKETFFFDYHYARGLEWYFSLFDGGFEGMLRSEVGATYFESNEARQRILETNPEAKVLITVRNPIARSLSSFCHECTKGRVGEDFFEAIRKQPRIINSGRYRLLAPEWETTFGIDRVFYLVQEDIEADPQGQLDTIFSFIGIEPVLLPQELHERYGQVTVPKFRFLAAIASRAASIMRAADLHRVVEIGKRLGLKKIYSGGDPNQLAMTRPVFDYLLSEHEADIQFLEKRLGRSFPHWRDPNTYGLER